MEEDEHQECVLEQKHATEEPAKRIPFTYSAELGVLLKTKTANTRAPERWYARAVSTANYGDEYCSMQPLR